MTVAYNYAIQVSLFIVYCNIQYMHAVLDYHFSPILFECIESSSGFRWVGVASPLGFERFAVLTSVFWSSGPRFREGEVPPVSSDVSGDVFIDDWFGAAEELDVSWSWVTEYPRSVKKVVLACHTCMNSLAFFVLLKSSLKLDLFHSKFCRFRMTTLSLNCTY